jgi:hypothetical protein
MSDVLTLDELFDMEMEQLEKEHGRDPDPDSWRWSPSDIRIWAEMLDYAVNYFRSAHTHGPGPISIWEAGSGIGTKLYLAKHRYGLIEYGFEKFDYYVAAARELGVACEQRDLSDLDDQPAWEVPDIVFTARPFKDDLLESKWEKLIQDRMRPGTVLMSTFTARKPYGWTVLYRATFRGVWVKPYPAQDDPESVQSVVTRSLPNPVAAGKPTR